MGSGLGEKGKAGNNAFILPTIQCHTFPSGHQEVQLQHWRLMGNVAGNRKREACHPVRQLACHANCLFVPPTVSVSSACFVVFCGVPDSSESGPLTFDTKIPQS